MGKLFILATLLIVVVGITAFGLGIKQGESSNEYHYYRGIYETCFNWLRLYEPFVFINSGTEVCLSVVNATHNSDWFHTMRHEEGFPDIYNSFSEPPPQP